MNTRLPSVVVSALILSVNVLSGALGAQGTPSLPLWPGRAPGAVGDSSVDRPTMMRFVPVRGAGSGASVVIFPGGGYTHLAVDKEGVQVADWLNGLGVTAFVVTYRLGPRYHHPAMLLDAQRAIRTVRANAVRWGLDPARIGVLGFSAGGHMAATAETHFDEGSPSDTDVIQRASSRPDFAVLVYPVITMDGPLAHRGSRENLLGGSPTSDLVRLMSAEAQVTSRTPPTFIVATTDDATVPVANSEMFYDALRTAHVPAELHIFETGRHGFGLAPANPTLAAWTLLCAAWMRRRGLLAAGM